MYIRSYARGLFGVRLVQIVLMMLASVFGAAPVAAQESSASHEDHAGQDMSQIAREASGTSWLPDESPMFAVHTASGPWLLMFHENAFVQYLNESGPRGGDQLGSINWIMGMAQRIVGSGRLGLRAMLSTEPASIRGCGYPDLLASGEQCDGQKIHDQQHPHDLFMELAGFYTAPIGRALHWQVYGGPTGEPALGPVAYPHRLSAMPNPLAPITHHWLDSTHVSFGVVTGGIYGAKWKAETSAFNGREPDEHRTDFDFGALDSVSGRVWFLPTGRVALQISAGHLKEAEVDEAGTSRTDVNRITASATYHMPYGPAGMWASTVAWGRNSEADHASNAFLVETAVNPNHRDVWFGRFEITGKTAHDLALPGDEAFTVSKIQGGYTRYFSAWRGFQPGLGAGLSLGIVPESLKSTYGSRANPGVALYMTLRPAVMPAEGRGAAAAGAGAMVMVQTSLDPARLTCSKPVDRDTAAKTVYEGKTYYFCSEADRDRFLTDPKMSLSMMPAK